MDQAVDEPILLSEQIQIPMERRQASIRDTEGQALANLIRQHGLSNSLEIGLAFGLSAAYILSAHEGPHVCIDPYQTSNYNDLGVRNLTALGFRDRMTLHREASQFALPRLFVEGARFDFVFIDGGHRYDEIFVDFYFSDRLLRHGGLIVFHDRWMRGTQLVLSFVKKNRPDYEVVGAIAEDLAAIRKVGSDQRPWHHFREFYNCRSMLRHHRYQWRQFWAGRSWRSVFRAAKRRFLAGR